MNIDEKNDIIDNLAIEHVQDYTPDMARAEIAKELMQDKNLERVTDLTEYQIAMASVCSAINSKTKSPVVDAFLKVYMETKISKDRLGREEVVTLARQAREDSEEKRPPWWQIWKR